MYKRVVVPLDGSLLAESMLRFVVDIAGPLDLEVVLLRMIRVLPPPVTEGVRAAVLESLDRRLSRFVGRLRDRARRPKKYFAAKRLLADSRSRRSP